MKNWQTEAYEVFNRITPIPPEQWQNALKYLYLKKFRKNASLLSAGETAPHSFLILKGIVRSFYITESGREYTAGFAQEGQFAGSVLSIIGGQPSRFFIESLEPVEAVILPRESVLRLYDEHRCWDRLGRIISESAMMHYEIKESEILDSLEDRYLRLIRTAPGLAARVPQHHLASCLGVTPEGLSRMKGRLKKNPDS